MTKHRYLRRNGHVLVALLVDEDDFEFATRFAEREGYFGPVDFIQSVLTPALWEWRAHDERLLAEGASSPLETRHDDDDDLRIVEDEGGHVRLAGGDNPDPDDDIPF
ncbi:hypothetical protein FHP25_14730 [Vineibacter terrae]|uniref:Uncharacterized protein n=1 Tax=Vineibacter terrae TaxID=2586908 RepID=A0A5C8PNG5_9HYPH|nr:hypothetical protein [Vineibacter terrae]TXL75137.1 hypothetical protein FHP25_14730 [Vineibacter terrae]